MSVTEIGDRKQKIILQGNSQTNEMSLECVAFERPKSIKVNVFIR